MSTWIDATDSSTFGTWRVERRGHRPDCRWLVFRDGMSLTYRSGTFKTRKAAKHWVDCRAAETKPSRCGRCGDVKATIRAGARVEVGLCEDCAAVAIHELEVNRQRDVGIR